MFLSKLARSFQTYANIYKKHVSQTESIENTSRRGISTTFSGDHWIMYDYCWDISVTSNNLLDLWQVPATSTAAIPPTPLLYICSCLPAQLPTKGCRWCCRRWRPLAGFPTSAGGFQVGKMRFVVEHVSLMFVSLVRLRRDLRRPSQNMEIYQALKQHPIKQRKTIYIRPLQCNENNWWLCFWTLGEVLLRARTGIRLWIRVASCTSTPLRTPSNLANRYE